ncbi:MAG: DUF1015 domain-containing protein [Catalinimonas sp.]
MVDILPFRAWRYAPHLTPHIESLTSPLFDVVSERQRERLYAEPLNSIHLSVPRADEGVSSAQAAAARLADWKARGVIRQDALPGLYVYYQHYVLPGSDQVYVRKGFFAHLRLHEWAESVVRRHESTLPGAVDDRTDLLAATRMHVSATHGLYTDPDFTLEALMDESQQHPIYDTEDYQGVRDVLSVIHDRRVIARFVATLRAQPFLILADGHHRYEASLAYRRRCLAERPDAPAAAPCHHHLMYLTNTEQGGLRVLPTHRLIRGLPDFDADRLPARLAEDFTVRELESPYQVNEIIMGKPWAFGLIFRDRAYKIRLRPERLDTMTWNFPDDIRALDLTVLHYFVIERGLGIAGPQQRRSPHVAYERSFPTCLAEVQSGAAQAAVITNELTMDAIRRVCAGGHTLPPKSTYFYPKVICGFSFSSLVPDEFTYPTDPCLALAASATPARNGGLSL